MDEATHCECSGYASVKGPTKPEANIFTITTVEEPSSNTSQTLHCHVLCQTYTDRPCEDPVTCKNRIIERRDCPIKEGLGVHNCGFKEVVNKNG